METDATQNKTIPTLPFRDLLVQGEANADKLDFTIPYTTRAGNDLTQFTFRMRAYNENHNTLIGEQVLAKTVKDGSIVLTWLVTGEYTKLDGKLYLEIIGVDSSGADRIIYTGEPIYVKAAKGAYNGTISWSDSTLEQLFAQFGTWVDEAKAQADRAKSEVDKAVSGAVKDVEQQIKQATQDAEKEAKEQAGRSESEANRAKGEANRSANEANRAANEANRATAEANRAQEIKESTEVLYDVKDYQVGFKHKLEPCFTYTKDLRGEPGRNGTITSLSPGLFGLSVKDGRLILTHNDNEPAPDMYINAEGHLIYIVSKEGQASQVIDLGYVIGPQGPQGETGEPFQINKVYPSVSEMFADYANPEVKTGNFVIIASSVQEEDNAKLYVKTDETFVFLTDLSGSQGIQGPEGKAATISIGTVTSGASPSVINSGTSTDVVLDFILEPGPEGKTGSAGISPTVAVNAVENGYEITITDETGAHTAVLHNGDTGPTGPAGPAGTPGKNGVSPTFAINANGHLIATYEWNSRS